MQPEPEVDGDGRATVDLVPMKILLVEDDPRVTAFIQLGLMEDGHVVDTASDADAGLSHAYVERYDVLIIDVMLPGRSGFDMTRELRSRGQATPILLLTARDARHDVVHGLDVGADDYLTKPFDFSELSARLRALGRRTPQLQDAVLRFADLEVDRTRHEVRRGGTRIDLTPTEFRLLEAFMRSPTAVTRRSELLDRVWGMHFDPGTSLIDVHVAHLRKKLEAGGRPRLIHTVKGIGFRMVDPRMS